MPLDNFGPVQFSIEGSFTDKPRLLMNGEEVTYDSISIHHYPEFKYVDFDGKDQIEPASTMLSFSVSAQIGQLEANVSYRVKANDENGLVLAKTDEKKDKKGGKPDFFKKKKDDKKSKDSKPGDKDKTDDKKDGKPDFKKFKKGKGSPVIQPDPRSRMGQQMFRDAIIENLTDEE